MTEAPANPAPRYRVSYSERVRVALRDLAGAAKKRGLAVAFRAALTEIDKRLHVYPQFGDPLRDLPTERMQLRIGTVSPLVVRYVVDEERRLVVVGIPFELYAGVGRV
jgi:hypothetical protein